MKNNIIVVEKQFDTVLLNCGSSLQNHILVSYG